ncbi:Uma2 family endonuclease [Desertifilum sp. FACHB-1129]|uniref:Putative restriction endonuclease domain-containing protein n=1 Tax=Desertifilum tharense IPPAS B-1220 TaxID=1781255 RepID=A0A1E5QEG6_9CYAN|nr:MULTISPECIES: Uma2 family endonuclease [Desertifilum]MDA0211975.1 Uma2 family endonuclease [Cyanobacteria bacterium FC1]MBD2313299.1 Uma2 family endonuclease [Desertifilum sp. FACHB-1129]MBD2324240.1 Uma2 family endonuclease [Desertifilum sp. FACHB-866]MBD2334254.1 Uma2 family endonuclease [Desertifilum sp. FACHB-868]OEJ73056.1 hypothetical protein BH720_21110 [Desertifilum tharense IPPAS B-1220]
MVQFDPQFKLPSSNELACSDDTPVDNENQNFIPNFLLFLLEFVWPTRQDWFWGVDMAIYHTTGASPFVPVVPDGFLSLSVEKRKQGGSRASYVVWEEGNVVPALTLEVVSRTPGGEYQEKMATYARLGVLYYVIYNPDFWQRDAHQPLEIYRLIEGEYQLQLSEPFWMPEIGLGIGRAITETGGLKREVLSWFNPQGARYLTPEEQLKRYQEPFGDAF